MMKALPQNVVCFSTMTVAIYNRMLRLVGEKLYSISATLTT
jgi:hypothetical protein